MNARDEVMDLRKFRSAPDVIRTVCCVCGIILKDGPPKPLSHGYCIPHMRETMLENECTPEEINEVIKQLNESRWERIWKPIR